MFGCGIGTVNDVVKGLTKISEKLDKIVERELKQAAYKEERVADLHREIVEHNGEAIRAKNVSKNISKLVEAQSQGKGELSWSSEDRQP